MRMRRRKSGAETTDELRRRIVEETSAYLTLCLQRPELCVRIPIIPSGAGRFPPSMTTAFWEPLLYE